MATRTANAALAIGSLTLAAAVASCVAQATAPATEPAPQFSPAPDMPNEWFLYDSKEMAAPQAELVGKPAPPWKVSKWFQGEVKPEETKGKIVVLDLWATWCAPCKAFMPHTDELAAKYKDQGVVIASICSDGDEDFVPKFIAEKGLKLPMAWDEGTTTYDAFKGSFFPTTVLIDRKGIVRAIGLTPDGLEKAVEKVLAEK